MKQINWMPGAVAAATNFSIPDNAPPIRSVVAGRIREGHSVNEGGTATYDIFSGPTAVTVTKVDDRTIQSDTAIDATDVFELDYFARGELGQEP